MLQEVMTAAFNAMIADDRPINVRPWLYRIARNRCLNHLRRVQAVGVDSMDIHLSDSGETTADKVHKAEEFRLLVGDIQSLPETQRTALVLREMDALSYEQISEAMETTVPSVKSLLVRARMSLAEAAEARQLSCEQVRMELAEVAEGLLAKATPAGPPPSADLPALRELPDRTAAHEPRAGRAAAARPGGPAQDCSSSPTSAIRPAPVERVGRHERRRRAGAAAGTGAAVGSGAAAGGALVGAGGMMPIGLGAAGVKAAAGLAAAALVTAGAVDLSHTAPVTTIILSPRRCIRPPAPLRARPAGRPRRCTPRWPTTSLRVPPTSRPTAVMPARPPRGEPTADQDGPGQAHRSEQERHRYDRRRRA